MQTDFGEIHYEYLEVGRQKVYESEMLTKQARGSLLKHIDGDKIDANYDRLRLIIRIISGD